MNHLLRVEIVKNFATQADFAHAMKLQEAFVSRVIRGRIQLKETELKRWAKALKCDPDDILNN